MVDKSAIDQMLQGAVKAGKVPGVVAMAADDGGVIYQGAFGRRKLTDDAPMTLDTVFRIASMTKAITGTAAMQMVEQGRLSLDQPAGQVMPELANPLVLEGFNDAGKPSLRPARGDITLRNLLTHTSGFVYDTWNNNMARFARETGMPAARTGKLAALNAPLGFDPGERWEYGIGIDWAGRLAEAVTGGLNLEQYMQRHIFAPLGMRDTSFDPRPEWASRTVTVHARQPNGSLVPTESAPPPANREFYPGGGGLLSTAPDYITFLRALLAGGGGVLKPETVTLMAQNHIGALNVRKLTSYNPAFSNDAEFFPGMDKKWGLTFLINTEDTPAGRSAGSLAWAGINNTYFWLDLKKRVAGVIMTQVLPFADPTVLGLLERFEAAIYGSR